MLRHNYDFAGPALNTERSKTKLKLRAGLWPNNFYNILTFSYCDPFFLMYDFNLNRYLISWN